jgi:outer membrane receptor protein involved in Fe transport
VVVTSTYTPKYRTDSTVPTEAIPVTNGLDGDHIPSSLLWDLQITYLPQGVHWLADSTFTLGVRNLFDRMPPFRSDGVSFYSRFDDPRMRFVYLRAEKRF